MGISDEGVSGKRIRVRDDGVSIPRSGKGSASVLPFSAPVRRSRASVLEQLATVLKNSASFRKSSASVPACSAPVRTCKASAAEHSAPVCKRSTSARRSDAWIEKSSTAGRKGSAAGEQNSASIRKCSALRLARMTASGPQRALSAIRFSTMDHATGLRTGTDGEGLVENPPNADPPVSRVKARKAPL